MPSVAALSPAASEEPLPLEDCILLGTIANVLGNRLRFQRFCLGDLQDLIVASENLRWVFLHPPAPPSN